MDRVSTEESLEESIFKTLSHQTRRDILRFIGEQKHASFTEIKNKVKVEDSASLSYHLSSLQPLVTQKDGKYSLTELGQDSYALINKTTAAAESNSTLTFLRRGIPWVIVANALLWAAALVLASIFQEGLATNTLVSFVVLWFASNLILQTILRKLGRKPCIASLT